MGTTPRQSRGRAVYVIDVRPLDPSLLGAFAELFDACASSCFCRYWHFEGNKNDWLGRLSRSPDTNRDEQSDLVLANDSRARGLLALEDGGRAVGWMKLAPRSSVPKLRRLPVYKALDLGDDAGVYSVACLLVRPDRRHAGVAKALLAAADGCVRAWGGSSLEAYPRRAREPMHDEEAWLGPEALFLGAGFVAVHDEAPYPVLRKKLDSGVT